MQCSNFKDKRVRLAQPRKSKSNSQVGGTENLFQTPSVSNQVSESPSPSVRRMSSRYLRQDPAYYFFACAFYYVGLRCRGRCPVSDTDVAHMV
eukprot:2327595-Rhodomonas_salina.3